MSLKRRADPLVRVIRSIAAIGLIAYAARQSVLVTAAVLVTMAVLSMATPRRKRRSRRKGHSTDIAVAASVTLLIWGGIVATFIVVDSADPELLAGSFYGGLTISSIVLVCVLTVAGASIAWSAVAREFRGRGRTRTSRRAAAVRTASTAQPAEAAED